MKSIFFCKRRYYFSCSLSLSLHFKHSFTLSDGALWCSLSDIQPFENTCSLFLGVFLWIVSSTSMVCWLPPVTQFHSQVSVLSGYMVKLRIQAYSTQQAACPHWQSHTKIHNTGLTYQEIIVTILATLRKFVSHSNLLSNCSHEVLNCWPLLLLLTGFYISTHVFP